MEWHSPPPPPPKARRWLFIWVGVVGTLGAFDYYRSTKHDGSTLSEVVRDLFDTDTADGKIVFGLALELGHAVFLNHIIK